MGTGSGLYEDNIRGNHMTRKWKGLPKRFSETGVTTLTVFGLSVLGMASIVPVLYFNPEFLGGTALWLWLLCSFLVSLVLGVYLSKRLVHLYRKWHGELILRKDKLMVRCGLQQREFEIDLQAPVTVEACWVANTRQMHGQLHANVLQNGQSLTLYADQGTANAGARLGVPRRPTPIPTEANRVRLHPIHLAEILELLQYGPEALHTPLDAPLSPST